MLTEGERTALLRAALSDGANYDREGMLKFAFSTECDQLSPLTVDHKILFIEAEVTGSDVGEDGGRVYLRQRAPDPSRAPTAGDGSTPSRSGPR